MKISRIANFYLFGPSKATIVAEPVPGASSSRATQDELGMCGVETKYCRSVRAVEEPPMPG